MIEKEYGKYTVVCDTCNEALPTVNTFDDALHQAKEAGWKTTRIEGDWAHICPACKEV